MKKPPVSEVQKNWEVNAKGCENRRNTKREKTFDSMLQAANINNKTLIIVNWGYNVANTIISVVGTSWWKKEQRKKPERVWLSDLRCIGRRHWDVSR